MKLMHTKLPEFIKKMHEAVGKDHPEKTIQIRGLENLTSAKMQSLRTGRIESAVEEIANLENVVQVEMVVVPRIPETMHTVVVKGLDKDGKTTKAILEVINILHPTEEVEVSGCKDVEDRRPKIGLH
jgi:GTP1/Obg family GTP-binding protein